jgi:adenosylcobinamide-GDP ribazoletransferase
MRRALSFLTPIGGARVPSRAALAWFPVVGAFIGLAVGGVWWLAARAWPSLVAAALAVVADLILTGGLHLDGLADAADGLLPPLPRERRLVVMADPAVGAFGVAAAAAVLLLRFAALASTVPVPLSIAALWCVSRTSMAVASQVVPYVRPGGLASVFVDDRGGRDPWVNAAVGAALAFGLALPEGWPAVAALAVAAAAFAAVLLVAWRRIGGFTGDVLGAAGMIAETVGLLVLAARW